MALPTRKTLGALRAEIAARLGFGSQGSAGGPKTTIINSFISRAQEHLYTQYEWPKLQKFAVLSPGMGQTLIDYPDDADPDYVTGMASSGAVTLTQPDLRPMFRGIELRHRNSGISSSRPLRYEFKNQIEIWPAPDVLGYTIRMDYVERLAPLVDDNSSLTLYDDQLVFLMALSNSKAHYRQPDAGAVAGQLNSVLMKLKQRKAGDRIFIRGVRPASTITDNNLNPEDFGVKPVPIFFT